MRTSSNVEVEAQENNGEERENCDLNVMEYRKWKSERICMNPRRHAGVGKKIPTGSVVGIFSLVEAAGIEPASASPLQSVLHT